MALMKGTKTLEFHDANRLVRCGRRAALQLEAEVALNLDDFEETRDAGAAQRCSWEPMKPSERAPEPSTSMMCTGWNLCRCQTEGGTI